MQIELKAIQREVGITFIFVTHDQEEALTMSDRVAVFNAGDIEQIGTPAQIYENPATEFVAGFVGTTNLSTFAVYFLQGRLGYAEEEAAGPASQMMMLVGVFMLLSALPSGWLSDRFGHKRFVAISGAVAAVGTLILILSPNLVIIYIGGCLIGIATGFFYTANWALGTSLVPKEEAGRYLGISNLAGAGAGAVGAYIGGPLADYFTVHAPNHLGLGYVVLFALYGIMFLFSLFALTRIRIKKDTLAV